MLSDGSDEIEVDLSWITDLANALESNADINEVRTIVAGRSVPRHLRVQFWGCCLGIKYISPEEEWSEVYDLEQQDVIRSDCTSLVQNSYSSHSDSEALSQVSDLEAILTHYVKVKHKKYTSLWASIITPLVSLNLSKRQLYTFFDAIIDHFFIDQSGIEKACDLMRLLILYHDPELCSLLDTLKMSPNEYAQVWLETLFSKTVEDGSLDFILSLWDVLFQQEDCFFIFFLCLVLIINAKDDIMNSKFQGSEMKHFLSTLPNKVQEEDIEDLCSIATYYSSKTPFSFRNFYRPFLFQTEIVTTGENTPPERAALEKKLNFYLSHSLCLPVSANEIIAGRSIQVRYFLIDCRPFNQYNAGHLATAFHLDAQLMLSDPKQFQTSVDTLLNNQKQALELDQAGEHFCFIGSGAQSDDSFLQMVIAHFLQRHCQCVSIVVGGYIALHTLVLPSITSYVVDHDPQVCIPCTFRRKSSETQHGDAIDSIVGFVDRISLTVREKSTAVKESLERFIHDSPGNYVQPRDHVSQVYGGIKPHVFSIADDDDDETSTSVADPKDLVVIKSFSKQPEMVHCFAASEILDDTVLKPSFLICSATHMYIVRVIPNTGQGLIRFRRALNSIVRITTKKKRPEIITFKYGVHETDGELRIWDMDRFLVQNPTKVTTAIKTLIMNIMDTMSGQ